MSKENISDILSPETLSQLANYNLLAKVAVDSFVSGLHRSVNHGFGSEFFQYRNYTSGDELKYVDWKVFGKTDKFYTKVFYEETNFNCNIVLDASASLNYKGSRASCSKFHYSAMLAATLAYMASQQGDNPSLLCYNEKVINHIPPSNSSGHIQRLLTSLSTIKPEKIGMHEKYLTYVASAIRKKGMLVLISDFLDADIDFANLFKKLGFMYHDCIVIQVLDKDELDLPFENTKNFIDSENSNHIITAPNSIRSDYKKTIAEHIENFKDSCLDIGIDYVFCDTTESIGKVLATYLHHKEGRSS